MPRNSTSRVLALLATALIAFSAIAAAAEPADDSEVRPPVTPLDLQIVRNARAILDTPAKWNRADNRKCPPDATKWSIYCAVEIAQRQVAGGFHHRRPAGELIRAIVEERTKDKNYQHRMMDYNNDATTHLADVKSLFAEALARIK